MSSNLIFVLGIRESTLLGFYFVPYLIQNKGVEYFKIESLLIKDDIDKTPENFDSDQKKIIKLIDEYSDNSLLKTFSRNKKISVPEFYANIEDELVETRIRPYIERRNVQIIDIATKTGIKIYLKTDRYENIYSEDEVKIEAQPAEAVFNFTRNSIETQYFLTVLHNNTEINLTNKTGITLSVDPCRIILGKTLFFFTDIDAKKLQPFFTKAYIPVIKRTEKKYYETFVLNAVKNFKVKNTGFEICITEPEKKAFLLLEKDWKNELSLTLKYKYDNIEYLANSKNFSVVKFTDDNDNYKFQKFERDTDWENNIKKILADLDLVIENETFYKIKYKSVVSDLQNFETINWLNRNSEKIKEKNIEIIQRFSDKEYFTGNINITLNLKTKSDWFDINMIVTFDEFSFPFVMLRDLIKKRERKFELPNGRIAILPEEWFAKYGPLLLHNQSKKHNILLKKHHFSLVKEAFSEEKVEINEIKSLFETFNNIEIIENEIPKNINATLRDYQKRGFAWLKALQKNNFGGCLADDMGLGKTLQTISLITKIVEENKTKKIVQPSLIIMPKSLIHNWKNEIKKFSPSLSVLEYSGSSRKDLENKIIDYDVVLTSYGVARNDVEILAKIDFLYLILDESQYVKNPDSKVYKALLSLNSRYKIVLTGTPIENSLQDLWSQLNFVNDGLLGSLRFFKENFIEEIEKNKDEKTQEKLKKLISPFVLRRTKDEVAKDLPPLTEQIIYCEMTEEQKKIYEEEKSKIRNKILELNEINQMRKSSIWVIKAMTLLRQLANHPKMIGIDINESGKFDEICTRIETLVAENHKVLIFSSFVKHLSLIEKFCIETGIEYSLLTGASTKRDQIISKFQNDENNKVFLISIKAGGVGLNLTSADYVFILDPWWNPAVENQAISRAHRIGQDKKVMVYKFITEETIEEKILQLQNSKSELAETFINKNNPLQSWSDETILELFN